MTVQIVALITAIGSLVVPPVVSFLKRENWSAQVNQLIAGVISLAVSAVAIWIVAPADFGLPFVTLAGLIYAGSQVIYGAYFKASVVESLLASVGKKVPPTPVPPAASIS
jgi:hypothetical protein